MYSGVIISGTAIPFLLIALAISAAHLTLPDPVNKSISLLGSAAIPLLIFILGLQLSNIKLKLNYLKIIFMAVCIRLVISPLITFPLLDLIGVTGLEQQVATVQTATPSALLPLMYAIRFNRSPDLLAAIILCTTVLSGISLTALIQIVG